MTSQSTSPEILSTLGPLEEKFIFLSPLGFLLFQEIRTFHIKYSKFAFQNLFIDILVMLQLYVGKLFRFLGNVTKPLKYFNILQRPYARWSISGLTIFFRITEHIQEYLFVQFDSICKELLLHQCTQREK